MKIFIISRGYPTEDYPLNGIFEFDQAKALAKTNNKIIFLAIDLRSIRQKRKYGFEKKTINNIEVRSINIPVGGLPNYLLNVTGRFGAKKLFLRTIKEFGLPDVVHSHFFRPSSWIVDIVKHYNIPFVITEHFSYLVEKDNLENLKKSLNYIYKQANKLLTVSPALKEALLNKLGFNSEYIPNVVDTNLFSPRPQKYIGENHEFIFVSVGNLIPRKQIMLVVKAFAQVFKDKPNTYLKVIGDGPEKEAIKTFIHNNNLQKQIKLLGQQPRSIIAQTLKDSDCFVLPSRAETFGVVYIEAMASGLPVIATKCGGPEHFVNDQNGLLIEKDNLNELSKAMLTIYETKKQYDSLKIAQFVDNTFSERALVKNLLNIYNQIL